MSSPLSHTLLSLALLTAIGTTAHADSTTHDLLATYRAALQNDPVFLAAEYQQLAAIEARPQARAVLLPQINLTANAARTNNDNDQFDSFTSSELNLRLTQTLYRRSNYITLSRAELQVEQAKATYIVARQSLLLRSAEGYFALLAAQDNLDFTRSDKEAIQRQLEQAERRFEVGLIAITDVKEAKSQYDLAVAQEIAADNQLATAREALRVLTGHYPQAWSRLDEASPLIAPDPNNIEHWVDLAKQSSPQLLVAQLASEIAKKSIALERAAHLPNTELVGSYTNSNSDGLAGDAETTQLRIQVSIPLYTGGLISSRVRQANASFELSRQQFDSQRRTTEQQTRDAYRSVLADISRVRALQQALISTQSGAEATQAGFDVGTRTAVEVLSALQETYRAQANYLRARYDFILNTLRLKQAAGTLVAADIEQVNNWLVQ